MIEIQVNNGAVLVMSQDRQYGDIEVCKLDTRNNFVYSYDIPSGDMVMLLNYYRYIKDNNIQCDFINPNVKE